MVRGIRGANRISENTREAILSATREVLQAMLSANAVNTEDIAAIYFTLTPDLNAAFPAEAARQLGMTRVPLLCMQEIGVPGSMSRVVRVLMLVNTALGQSKIKHVFLGDTQQLRDDLQEEEG
ncbi:MAG TPA: chorismate mutase [Bacteroidetes bacterium]|nr:chorismate mutase [Bacteroidota bacterium]